MSSLDKAMTTKKGAIFIQPDGPNTRLRYLNARTLGGLKIDNGSRELIQSYTATGTYVTNGSKKKAPGMVSTSMEILLKRKPEWFERLSPTSGYTCQFPIYIAEHTCGRADDPDNFVRLLRLNQCDISTETYDNIVNRMDENESMYNVDIEAEPPAHLIHEQVARRLTSAEVNAFNDIWVSTDFQCDPDCGTTYSAGDVAFAVCDSTSSATPNVYFTFNGGTTWTVGGTDPGTTDDDIAACTAFPIGNGRLRYMVAKLQATTTQGQIFYSDATIGSLPTSWTAVSIGGATANHNAAKAGCLFALDREHIWLATQVGYIYFSSDGGATWTAQESGTIHSGAYNFIHFSDESYGIAVGAADVVAVTSNGGASWTAATATGASAAINSCWRIDNNRLWCSASGRLYYSNDNGVTWTRRTGFTNDGTGTIKSMAWLNEYDGFIVHDNASPVGTCQMTINGGYTWKDITTPTNAGLNSVRAVNNNLAYFCGEPQGSLGFLGKQSLLYSELD